MLLLLAVAVLVVMLFVFAELTGWRSLARRYRHPGPGRGRRYADRGVIIGSAGWNAPPLGVRLDDEAIWLQPRSFFAIAFPSACIPWTHVASVERRALLLADVVELRFGDGKRAVIGFVHSPAATAIEARFAEICAGGVEEPASP